MYAGGAGAEGEGEEEEEKEKEGNRTTIDPTLINGERLRLCGKRIVSHYIATMRAIMRSCCKMHCQRAQYRRRFHRPNVGTQDSQDNGFLSNHRVLR